MQKIKDILSRIKNLIYWIPVIWKDQNSDFTSLLLIIKHKLNAKKDFFIKHQYTESSLRDARYMKICSDLLEKILDEFYGDEYLDYIKTEISFVKIPNNLWRMESKVIWEKLDDYFDKYPLIYKRVLNGEGLIDINSDDPIERKERIAMNISQINSDRAYKLLFKILRNEITNWWI